ncbi:hypothetical protein TRVA0_007S04016 [Trichomonascus vanleenenianus]|uniref:YqaE/Pmp3 family membrane protein n=1 Tax=Trichomonascus vanleenenianus TaxID=2268995 RepID=UPI003ECA3D10
MMTRHTHLLTTDLLLALLALFVPPFPVIIKRGLFTVDTLLNVALTMLGGIPGVAHAWYIILKYPDDGIPFLDTRRGSYDIIPDAEEGSTTPPPGGSDGQTAGVYQDSSSNAAGSSSAPPQYTNPPTGDNKIQYDH